MDSKKDILDQYLLLILEANKKMNLTRIDSFEQAQILHIEDSLAALPEINAASSGLYGDLGTGGGFPGFPVAIYTGRKTVLIDSVKKKMSVLESIVSQLGLSSQITCYSGRIEDLAREKGNGFSVLTARALSKLPSLVELASPLLSPGGRLVSYKANVSEEEIENALFACSLVGMELVSRRSLMLSDGSTYREIIVFEKTSKPKMKLPRRVGLAQHSPLVK